MKHLIYIVLVLLLSSCVDMQVKYYDYVIYNQTDKMVKVLGFKTHSLSEVLDSAIAADPILISPNGKFEITRENGMSSNVTMRFYSIRGVDSVRVIFNEEKVLICADDTITDQTIYSGDGNHEHYITEQDFEDAESCNGDCE